MIRVGLRLSVTAYRGSRRSTELVPSQGSALLQVSVPLPTTVISSVGARLHAVIANASARSVNVFMSVSLIKIADDVVAIAAECLC